MKTVTLKEVLLSQDMGEKNADNLCDDALSGSMDAERDPISFIISKAFIDNEYSDYEGMAQDLSYAINQLAKAKEVIQKTTLKD